MILSFKDKRTMRLWQGERILGLPVDMQDLARRKLRMLNSSQDIRDLQVPPSNRLEKLKGDLKKFYSIRVNDRWRLIFIWENGNASQVQFIDYHK